MSFSPNEVGKPKSDNCIIGEIIVNDDDKWKELRIINSYECFKKEREISKSKFKKDENEFHIRKNVEIYINEKPIEFSYNYCFGKVGTYKIEYLISENLTKGNHMFADCSSLISLDFSGFNTKNIIYFKNMFYNCKKLKELNLSKLNTSNVINMMEMFSFCESLNKLDLSDFNTEKVTNMNSMFSDCKSLTDINLSSFNTSNVKQMVHMFSGCIALTKLNLSNFTAESIKDVRYMFMDCKNLEDLDLSNFEVNDEAIKKDNMFDGCFKLKNKISNEKNDEENKVKEIGEKQTSKNVNNNKLNVGFEFKDNSVSTNNNVNNKKNCNKSANELENGKKSPDGKGCGGCPCSIF